MCFSASLAVTEYPYRPMAGLLCKQSQNLKLDRRHGRQRLPFGSGRWVVEQEYPKQRCLKHVRRSRWEVQKAGWKISSVEDGFSGVQIVIFGAAEVGKFCNFNRQMQSNIGDWNDCVCRSSFERRTSKEILYCYAHLLLLGLRKG